MDNDINTIKKNNDIQLVNVRGKKITKCRHSKYILRSFETNNQLTKSIEQSP